MLIDFDIHYFMIILIVILDTPTSYFGLLGATRRSKKSLKIALHAPAVSSSCFILRQHFNNGHTTLWHNRHLLHACTLLWASLLQYHAAFQTLHFSMIASFAQI